MRQHDGSRCDDHEWMWSRRAFGVQKNPSFYGEYDTRRFFVCWWYTGHCLPASQNGGF